MSSHRPVYEPLPEDTIRVLKLHPGLAGQPLTADFSLQQATHEIRSDGLPYDALSYTWGAPNFPQTITIRSSRIPITQHLFDALQHLRHPTKEISIWVDALCINQKDETGEKEKQIFWMRDIYANAQKVIIWLGSGDGTTGKALELIHRAALRARDETKDMSELASESYDESRNTRQGFPARDAKEEWEPLYSFLSLPWFTRVWIVQEVVSARSAVMMIGDVELAYSDFCAAIIFFQRKGYSFLTRDGDLIKNTLVTVHNSRIGRSDSAPKATSLLLLLQLTRKFLATDPRDKVYALLGMTKGSSEFPSDYKTEVRKVFIATIWYLLAKETEPGEDPLGFLSEVSHGLGKIDDAFPSWVPRWHVPPTCHLKIRRLPDFFNAGGQNRDASNIQFPEEETLKLGGFVVGEIQSNTECVALEDNWTGDTLNMLGLFSSMHQFLMEFEESYPTGEDIYDVLAQVLAIGGLGKQFGALHYLDLFMEVWSRVEHELTTTGSFEVLETLAEGFEGVFFEFDWRTQARQGSRRVDPSFFTTMKYIMVGRKPLWTTEGHIGLGPGIVLPGDKVCVFYGGEVPYILRPIGDQFQLVGECYLHGIMNGEGMNQDRWVRRSFYIV